MDNNKNYIPACGIIGGVSGAVYGWKHPSEKTCMKIAKVKPTFVETMQGYKDCFNMQAAENAFNEEKITKEEYEKLKNLYSAISDTYEKEKKVVDISNTPYEERTESFRSAVRDAYSVRPKLWKNMMKFNKELQDKFAQLNIFNKNKFADTLFQAGTKLKVIFKELSKCASIGLAFGAVLGSGLGYFLNKIANNK